MKTKQKIEAQRISYTDKKIHTLVYELYGLTEDEIKAVEGEWRKRMKKEVGFWWGLFLGTKMFVDIFVAVGMQKFFSQQVMLPMRIWKNRVE